MKNTMKLFIPLLVLSVSCLGCGAKKTNGPATVKVTGTVSVNGSPAKENIQITFHPIGEGQQTATGKTDGNGKYSLFTGRTGTPGVMAGKYKILARDIDAGDDESYMDQTEDNVDSASGSESSTPKVGGEIPEKYSSAETSDHEVEITSSTTTLDIELK
ncbi:hypothetical protein OAG51_01355 [Pirellulaceae bacterium]|nr:hypothetical protein [Pirellulaceae bacterium]